MKLTINLTGKTLRYQRTFSVRTLVSLTVLSSLFMLVSSRSTESVNEDLARIALAQQAHTADQEELEALKLSTEAQLQVLIEQLARLNSKMSQLDGRGQQIAEQLGMKAQDLDAFTLPATSTTLDNEPLLKQLHVMEASLENKSRQIAMLESLVSGHHIQQQSQLSGRPVEAGWLSSYYGMRTDPFNGKPAMHKGLDFAGAEGDNVVATAAGIVTWAAERYGYGNLVEIEHKDGYITRYGHNQSIEVAVGEVVTKGQAIAIMGNTGRSTGAHVHYEVIRHGQPVDPLPFTRN
ncbi:peptidoglycan DD-metalloendopeptidase family protein [Salinimonas marina]|uniref:Peptidoglycan DD-metalloendopeptidase family protein n=1 Tax=Salinimonas marina TaxID=2785918 RepID=A0A7S9DYH8_9ALTE|nr:M23 family metallopeptidase [Salinimonas marina]QPG06294.1 peptidoglycan DD-metalloendopeptidase family protein [Salinimonas marina]